VNLAYHPNVVILFGYFPTRRPVHEQAGDGPALVYLPIHNGKVGVGILCDNQPGKNYPFEVLIPEA